MEAGTASLRDLRGPSALSSGGWRRFWRLLWKLTKSEFQLRYSQPILGYVWSLLGPLLLAAVLYLVFTRFVRFGGRIEDYAVLLIFNILMFFFFVQGTAGAVRSFIIRQNLTRKVEVPLLVVPFASVASNFLSFCINMVVAFALLIVAGIEIRWTWLLFPVIVLGWIATTSVAAVLLASLYVRARDIGELWTATHRALFYVSPVIFPIEFYPKSWEFILQYNPLAPILAQARVWIVDPSAPTYAEQLGGDDHLLIPLGMFLLGLIAAVLAFRRFAPRAAEL